MVLHYHQAILLVAGYPVEWFLFNFKFYSVSITILIYSQTFFSVCLLHVYPVGGFCQMSINSGSSAYI